MLKSTTFKLPLQIELSVLANRAIRIEYSKKHLIITDEGKVSRYMPLPFGQTRLADYGGKSTKWIKAVN